MMILTKDNYNVQVRSNLKGGEGDVTVTEYVPGNDMVNCRLLCEQLIPVGGSIGLHTHIKETEFYIITQGKGRVVEAEGETDVSEGDVVVTSDGESHSIANIGDNDLKMTAIIVTH